MPPSVTTLTCNSLSLVKRGHPFVILPKPWQPFEDSLFGGGGIPESNLNPSYYSFDPTHKV